MKEHNAHSKGFFTGKRSVPNGSTHIFIYFFPFSLLKEEVIPRKQGLLKFPVN